MKTSRAIEICLSRLKMDDQTASALKRHLTWERQKEEAASEDRSA